MVEERVIKIYRWFQRAMQRMGRKVAFPKDTPPEKTYLYRSLKRFADKVDDWELSDDMVIMMIALVIRWAAKKDMLHRGASLLTMTSVLDICYEEMKAQSQKRENLCREINRCQEFVRSNPQLLRRMRRGGMTNLTCWYQTGRITIPFLSVSKSCNDALASLPEQERTVLPSDFDLLRNRIYLLADTDSRDKISAIMGPDLLLKGV